MPSDAFLLAEKDCHGKTERYVYKGYIGERHFGGVFVNADTGRPLEIGCSSGGKMGLPGNNTWGNRDWHEYCLTPDGLFEGDVLSDDGYNSKAKDERGRDKTWEELLSFDPTKGETDNLWELAGLVEPWNPEDLYGDEEGYEYEAMKWSGGPVSLSLAGKGDQIELVVMDVSMAGEVRFVAEFVEQDELVGDRSIRIFNLISSNGYPPFLVGETVTAVVKTVHIAPASKRTKDGRGYIFFGVDVVAFR